MGGDIETQTHNPNLQSQMYNNEWFLLCVNQQHFSPSKNQQSWLHTKHWRDLFTGSNLRDRMKRSTELDTELMLLHLPQLTSSLGSLSGAGFKSENCGLPHNNKTSTNQLINERSNTLLQWSHVFLDPPLWVYIFLQVGTVELLVLLGLETVPFWTRFFWEIQLSSHDEQTNRLGWKRQRSTW